MKEWENKVNKKIQILSKEYSKMMEDCGYSESVELGSDEEKNIRNQN